MEGEGLMVKMDEGGEGVYRIQKNVICYRKFLTLSIFLSLVVGWRRGWVEGRGGTGFHTNFTNLEPYFRGS